ncbi:hypothetical protein MUK42_18008 [Musa troglodytarum]|uniref:Transcription repressor n=3 Tax=Musa troglodytarum TaxID=320322 RepID=A0A9E7H7L6_9LILI|nr:hypothetical protein MUK42_18008 [Musa troglodytarum]
MEKLKSSLKSLQGGITNIKPSATCIQEPKTQSFREVGIHSSFCRLYCDSAAASASSSDHPNINHQPPIGILVLQPDEENVCSDAPTMSSSSSSTSPTRSTRENDGVDNLPLGPISSKRFFFSPRTTNCIMEEAKPGTGVRQLGDTKSRNASFCDGSMTVTMDSQDPYCDFRASMEEMVAAHELWDWRCLQELLHCYLRLNEEKQHKVIVLAFTDLLMQPMSRTKEGHPSAPRHLTCYPGEM